MRAATVVTLREQWNRLFGAAPPKAFGPDLLRRGIAQRLQERAYGGLSKQTSRLLDKLVSAYAKQDANEQHAPVRRIRSGAILHREWKGVSHCVTVHGDQFLYQCATYSNLSQIARLITGTRWNGPRFFGLRATQEADRKQESGPAARPDARPSQSPSRRERVRPLSSAPLPPRQRAGQHELLHEDRS